MQPNTLTLNVDVLNDGTTVPQVYSRSEQIGNRSVYIGASHKLDMRDTITLYRSYPNENGNFKGVQKTSIKFTRDVVVPGKDSATSLTAPMIKEVSFSIPVGSPEAEILELRQLGIALEDDDTVMDPLNLQLLV